MNALYEVSVTHCRVKPKRHAFTYQVFMLAFDLDDLTSIARRIPCLSHNGFNLFSINDCDHVNLGESGGIRPNLMRWLSNQGISVPGDVRIQLVTFPRVLGYGFNPVSFFYIRTADGKPLITVAEVVNTFREMKLYPLDGIGKDGLWHRRVAKNFYVSPFSDPGMDFDFHIGLPEDSWRVNIDVYDPSGRVMLTAMHGEQRTLTSARLFWYAFKYPALSLKIIGLIHWHALLLWLKKVPYFRKNQRLEAQLDVMRPHTSLKERKP
ncbi:MAG: DUF1365 domain-containing protein [Gloeobacteraceae cyanobacterium ES-bin-144]|nr:DUF1365 domain-containing protein [Verrucomicrobiales bacterium]